MQNLEISINWRGQEKKQGRQAAWEYWEVYKTVWLQLCKSVTGYHWKVLYSRKPVRSGQTLCRVRFGHSTELCRRKMQTICRKTLIILVKLVMNDHWKSSQLFMRTKPGWEVGPRSLCSIVSSSLVIWEFREIGNIVFCCLEKNTQNTPMTFFLIRSTIDTSIWLNL